jgi:acetyl-CoA synthetase (ADP-forming)
VKGGAIAKSIVEQLQPIFAPKSVAVIGASSVPFKWGYDTISSLQQAGYKGAIYPINPRESQVLGLPVYRNVRDVPGEIDLAVIVIRVALVPQAIRECVQKGVKGAVIITAGFAEVGPEGQALQEEVTAIARQGGLRFVGPNCMGILSSANNLNLCLPNNTPKGSIGFISQSGTFGGIFARLALDHGYGLSKFISAGNQADLDAADYLEFLADDPETKSIVMYVEGFRDGRKLFHAAQKMAGKKPVIVYKAGKNQLVARVAMSHTASIAGEDRVFDALCQQVGFIRSEELLESLDMAAILTRQPLPRANRVGILGTGGQCVVLADTCVSMGLQVPELKTEDIPFIISDVEFPPHAPAPRNPVDFAGANRTALMEASVLNRMAQLDYIDCFICNTPISYYDTTRVSAAEQEKLLTRAGELLTEIPQKYGKPLVTVGFGFGDAAFTSDLMKKILDNAGITSYSTPEAAVKAIWTLLKYAEIKRRFTGS